MTILAPTTWRVRPDGNILNGAGFDAVSYGSGVDYSDQASPQLSITDIVGNGTTTITSATGGFTSAGITRGNYLNLTTAPGGTVGFYPITSVVDNNTVVLGRTPGTFTGGVGRVGGAFGGSTVDPHTLGYSSRAVGNRVVPGNIVYIRGSGSENPTSADYTITSVGNPIAGNATEGPIKWIGYNGMPRIHVNQRIVNSIDRNRWCNLYYFATANTNMNAGMFGNSMFNCAWEDVLINTNNLANAGGIDTGNNCEILNCEITSGTATPTASAGSFGLQCNGSNGGTRIVGSRIYNMGGRGINITTGSGASVVVMCNTLYGNLGVQIFVGQSAAAFGDTIINNVIHGGGSHGIQINTAFGIEDCIFNNIISNHTASSVFGINIASGSAALVNALRRTIRNNAFFNNTSHRSSNLSASAGDVTLSVSPYVDAAAGDFRLNNTAGGGADLRGFGFPILVGTYPKSTGGTRAGFPDIGAIQNEDAGGGGGSTRTIFMGGAF